MGQGGPIGGGVAAGGINLGQARGRVSIEFEGDQAHAAARAFAQQIDQAMRRTEQSTRRAESGFARVQRSLRDMRGEIQAVGLAAGVLTGLGLRAAGSFEEMRIATIGMAGGIKEGEAALERLTQLANQFRLPLNEVLGAFQSLGPLLDNDIERFERFLDLARRLAVRNPREGIAGAAFSIGEALSSGGTDLVSLTERFNIPRTQLREATEATGDFGTALDIVLDRMGLTTQTADAMGQSFNRSLGLARDQAVRLLAEGFTPLLEDLTQLLQRTADWLAQLRETNPEAVRSAANLIAITAAAAPAVLAINQLAEAYRNLKIAQAAAAIRGGTNLAGRLGGAAIGAGVGLFGASQAVRFSGRATGNEELQQFNMGTALRMIVTQFRTELTQWLLQMGQFVRGFVSLQTRAAGAFINGIASMTEAIGGFVQFIGQFVPGRAGANLRAGGQQLLDAGGNLRETGLGNLPDVERQINAAIGRLIAGAVTTATPLSRTNADDIAQAEQFAAERAALDAARSQDEIDAAVDRQRALQQIEEQANDQRIEATRQYEEQRTQVIQDYQRNIAREEEDFQRQRLRQAENLQRQIADIQQAAAERETEWREDLVEREAEIREDAAERITDLEDDYRRRRIEAERAHRDNLMSAAGRLDAIAIQEEQRRFGRQSQNDEEQFGERVSEVREQERERLAEEREGHQERLQEAREADQERIQDLRDGLVEQQRIEDEDRAIRLRRQAEDHQRQLTQLANQHTARIEQINRQAADEREAANQAYTDRMNDLDIFYGNQLQQQNAYERAALKSAEEYWKAQAALVPRPPSEGGGTGPSRAIPGEFATGGPVRRTGMARVHAGEYVINRQNTRALSAMLNGGMDQSRFMAAAGGGRSVTLNAGAIQIYGVQNAADVRRELEQFFERMA